MALAIVQNSAGASAGSTSVPGNVVLGSAPTVGNLVVVFLHTDGTANTIPTINTSAYQQIADTKNADINSGPQYVLVRYVQAGDTASLPAMATAGACHFAYVAYEISGVAGTIDTDLQVVGAVTFQTSGANPLSFPTQTPQSANTLALGALANKFAGSPATVPSGWTADVNTGAQSATWGMQAAMHQANGAVGTPISVATSSVSDILQVILQASTPSFPYVHSEYTASFDVSAGTYNTPVLLQKAPKVGNLLIGFAHFYTGTAALVTVASGWTQFARISVSTNDFLVGMYRYAQAGDTASLTPFFTDTTSAFGWGYSAYELAGVAGNWAADFQSVKTGKSTAASFTTTTDTTLQPNTLALVGSGIFANDSATPPTVGSGWAFDGGAGGTFILGSSKTYASSSSSVSNTVTYPASGNFTWAQALFGAASAVNVNLTGAASAGAAAAATPEIDAAFGTVSASGAVAAGTPRISIALQPASSSGAVNIVTGGQGVGVSPATSSGAAAAVVPRVSVGLVPASALGAVAGLSFSEQSFLNHASAAGAAANVGTSVSVALAPAISSPAAAPITFGQQIPFPLSSIMRDTPVACIGSMADTPIALIGRLPPSGPEPFGVEVFLAAVSATAHAATITPTFDVKVPLAAAIATGTAAPVVAA